MFCSEHISPATKRAISDPRISAMAGPGKTLSPAPPTHTPLGMNCGLTLTNDLNKRMEVGLLKSSHQSQFGGVAHTQKAKNKIQNNRDKLKTWPYKNWVKFNSTIVR